MSIYRIWKVWKNKLSKLFSLTVFLAPSLLKRGNIFYSIDKMNKLIVYLMALISGVIGVFAFFAVWLLGISLCIVGRIAFCGKKVPKNQPHFLLLFVVDGLFSVFGVSWLNVSIHQFWWRFPWRELSLSRPTFGLPCTLSQCFSLI